MSRNAIIDTNVAMVANGMSDNASNECVTASANRLLAVMESEYLCLDDQGMILTEYTNNLGHSGAPGIGKAFVKWVFNNQYNEVKCKRVALTLLKTHAWRVFEEIPDDAALRGFDRSDQKFLAVALVLSPDSNIVNAVDSDWSHYKDVICSHGTSIEFICPDECS